VGEAAACAEATYPFVVSIVDVEVDAEVDAGAVDVEGLGLAPPVKLEGRYDWR